MHLTRSLEPDQLTISILLGSSAVIGIVTHLALFIQGEWHLKGPWVASGHLLAVSALYYILRSTLTPESNALGLSFAMFGCYVVSLFASITTYRLFFHQLRHFSGPKIASITKLWHVFQCRDRKNFMVFHNMYEKYGDIVRTGPNEISIFRPHAIELFDAHKSKTVKSEWYDVMYPKSSAVFSRDHTEHATRRRLWSKAMSIKAIDSYLPRIVKQVDTFQTLVDSYKGKPILINDVMAYFAFDSMGEFMFNQNFGMMTSNQWHPTIYQQKCALAMLGILAEIIWGVRLAFAYTPWFGYVKDWLDMVAFCDEQMEKRMQLREKQTDIAAWFIEEFEQNQTQSLQRRRDILSGNTITAMVAGSDTTRPSLIAVWYYLAKHPEHQEKIFEELKGKDVNSLSDLASAAHMNACINEGMRLMPAAMTGATRITNDDGLWIDDETWIPGGTKIAAPRYTVMRLPTAFKQPEEYIPERWTTQSELVIDARAFAPFGSGPRQCIGKNLALTEIRLVTARLIANYKANFPPGFDALSVERELRDQVTAQPGDCWIDFEPRTVKGDSEKDT